MHSYTSVLTSFKECILQWKILLADINPIKNKIKAKIFHFRVYKDHCTHINMYDVIAHQVFNFNEILTDTTCDEAIN